MVSKIFSMNKIWGLLTWVIWSWFTEPLLGHRSYILPILHRSYVVLTTVENRISICTTVATNGYMTLGRQTVGRQTVAKPPETTRSCSFALFRVASLGLGGFGWFRPSGSFSWFHILVKFLGGFGWFRLSGSFSWFHLLVKFLDSFG